MTISLSAFNSPALLKAAISSSMDFFVPFYSIIIASTILTHFQLPPMKILRAMLKSLCQSEGRVYSVRLPLDRKSLLITAQTVWKSLDSYSLLIPVQFSIIIKTCELLNRMHVVLQEKGGRSGHHTGRFCQYGVNRI